MGSGLWTGVQEGLCLILVQAGWRTQRFGLLRNGADHGPHFLACIVVAGESRSQAGLGCFSVSCRPCAIAVSVSDLSYCGGRSGRIHSRCERHLLDLLAHGRHVRIRLVLRQFRCASVACQTRIFAERSGEGVVRPFARSTARLQTIIRPLGLALRGRPVRTWRGGCSFQ